MARREDDGESRPKRSWREIDRMRDKSSGGRSSGGRPAQQQERLERSQAYRQYKANLDKFFSGTGSAPEGLKGLLDPTGEKSARTKAIEEIQKASAEDRRRWSELVKEFVAQHELPEDPFLLTEFLGHPREAVAAKALEKLASLVADNRIKKVPASLDQQLRSLELTADDDAIKAAARSLREKLRG